MNSSQTDYPVVIVGAGPSGVTAATLLGQYGVRCLLLDRWSDVYPQPRAVHLDDEVYRILGHLGVADQFADISRPSLGLRLLSPSHKVLAEFGRDGVAPKSGYPRANMFDQPVLEQLLRANLSTAPSVDFVRNAEVLGVDSTTDGAVAIRYTDKATEQQRVVTAQYVLGCDGANSIVRRAIGSEMLDLKFEQRWLVIDVDTEIDLDQWEGVHQVCDSRRAGTYMRINETRYRWEFALLDSESTADFPDVESLMPLIQPWTRELPPHDLKLVRVAEYTFRAMVADRWRQDNVFLLGDAAHLTPPFIGQGMGAGLRDAHNLAWKLASVINGSLPSHVLDSYEIERKPHVTAVIKLARLMGVVMTKGGRTGDSLRGLIAPALPRMPGVRARVLDSETKPLTANRWISRRRRDRLAGALIPNARVAGKCFDELNRTGLTIVALRPVAAELNELGLARHYPVVEVTWDHALGQWLRHGGASAAIIRPDSTVLASEPSCRAIVRDLTRLRRD